MKICKILFLLIIIFSSCKKTKESRPVVETLSVKLIAPQTVIYECNVKSDGGLPILERGIIYCVCSRNEELKDGTFEKTRDGVGAGKFTNTIGGLYKNADLYWRAYATNALGTNYENVIFCPTGL